MEVIVRDFNCIENIGLEFKPGFTILQGPSNSGKSSVIKAIENTIFNQSGTTNIRQGQNNYSVGIKHNGHTVSLIKGKSSKYKVDDEIYEKFGVNQLPEVADALNIRETILGGEKVRLNFSRQMSYPFLLDKTPGQLYRFIVDSSESESLSNVLKDISKDIKDLEKNVVQNEAQMDILIKQQTQLNYNLLHADTVLDISSKILDLDSTDSKITQLCGLKDNYSKLSADIVVLKDNYNRLSIPSLDDKSTLLDKLKDDYNNYYRIANQYKNVLNLRNSLNDKFTSLSTTISTDEIDKLKDNYTILVQLVAKYKNINTAINTIKENIDNLDSSILNENEKLSKFDICPLCGSSIKC